MVSLFFKRNYRLVNYPKYLSKNGAKLAWQSRHCTTTIIRVQRIDTRKLCISGIDMNKLSETALTGYEVKRR